MKKQHLIVCSAVAFTVIGTVAASFSDYDLVATGLLFAVIGVAVGVFAARSGS